MTTLEALATPIRLAAHRMNVQALVARLAGVRRTYGNDLNSGLDCFVGKKQTQLKERPTVRSAPLSFIARQFIRALSDACQILHGDRCIQGFSLLHNGFADPMVQPYADSAALCPTAVAKSVSPYGD